MDTNELRDLLRDLLPALDAYGMTCRLSSFKEGVLHWEMTARYWKAQHLRARVEAVLAAQPEAQAGGAVSAEDRFEQFVQQAIAKSPEPLRELGEYLSGVLDEDEWPKADRLLLQLAANYTTPPAKVPDGDEVVGHKTFSDGRGGFRHEPLTRAEADALIAHCNSEDERRKALMPDERSAIRMMMDAHTRLTDMGWKDAVYCPKDGTIFEVIEPGSTGIHKCVYWGDWPNGGWWVMDDGDMSPSRPVLFRALAAAPAPNKENEQ